MSIKEVRRYYLGESRGNKRIWLDGNALGENGFQPSVRYSRTVTPEGSIILTIDPEGAYVVSKKVKNGKEVPVIDMVNKTIDQCFSESYAIEVRYGKDKIIINKSELDKKIIERENRIVSRLKQGEALTTGSLYHGGGIMDSGLHEGLKISEINATLNVAVEIEPEYLKSSMKNNSFWADGAWAVNSPTELTLHGSGNTTLDILTMGIPCTGASKAGKSKNHLEFAEDHKSAGAQFYYALKWIEATNPSIVIIENVPEYQNTAAWHTIKAVLNNLGYDTQLRVFNGLEFGAIENRNRMIAVAVSHGIEKQIDFDINKVMPRITKPTKLEDILDHIPLDSTMWKTLNYLKEKEVRDTEEGKGFRLQWLQADKAESIGTIGRGYSKLRGTEPFIIHPEDPNKARILTPVEHARAKTIPESLIRGIESATTAHEILGQSVIREWFVQIGSKLGENIRQLEYTADRKGMGKVREQEMF